MECAMHSARSELSMSRAIYVMLLSGTRERLQMAGMTAAVAAVSGNDVTVFVSMNALEHFVRGNERAAQAEGDFGRLLAEKRAPDFKSLFEQAAELGNARIHPCSMAMDVMGLEREALEAYVGEPLGLTKFLDDAANGQLWTF
jgi:peroxiredoxin family protein